MGRPPPPFTGDAEDIFEEVFDNGEDIFEEVFDDVEDIRYDDLAEYCL